jgi:hypothetical protein
VLARSITTLLCWFREQEGSLPEPSRVEIIQTPLDTAGETEAQRRDYTIEAHVVAQKLSAFLKMVPEDFIV